jgi:hypothetical protein
MHVVSEILIAFALTGAAPDACKGGACVVASRPVVARVTSCRPLSRVRGLFGKWRARRSFCR